MCAGGAESPAVTWMLTTAGPTFSIMSAKLTGRALPATAAAAGAVAAVSVFEVPIATAPPAMTSTATTAATLPAVRPRFVHSCVFIVLLLCWPVADGGAKRGPPLGRSLPPHTGRLPGTLRSITLRGAFRRVTNR